MTRLDREKGRARSRGLVGYAQQLAWLDSTLVRNLGMRSFGRKNDWLYAFGDNGWLCKIALKLCQSPLPSSVGL